MHKRSVWVALLGVALSARVALAQPPASAPVMERVTFDEAVRRALERNPTIAEAATAVLRAEGLLQQARAATLPGVSATVNNVLINSPQGFAGTITQPRNQTFVSGSLSMPILAASQWAAA